MKFLVVLLAIGFVHAGVLNSKSDNNVFKGTYGFFLPGHKNATNIIGVKDIYAPESNEITITFPEVFCVISKVVNRFKMKYNDKRIKIEEIK